MTIQLGPAYGAKDLEQVPDPEILPSNAGPKSESKHDAAAEPVPQEVAAATEYWLAQCNRSPSEAVRGLRDLAARAADLVVQTVLAGYEPGRWTGASPFLERLLSGLSATAFKLCDPTVSIDHSVRIAEALTQQDPQFDARFAKRLLEDGIMNEGARHRGLVVLGKLGSGSRLMHILIQILRNPDTRIRSKAALLFGQTMPTRGIMERLMKDSNARVRANFIEGLWSSLAADYRPVFRVALKDPHHRVAGNGLIGLYRLGETREFHRHVSRMAHHPEAAFRAMAAWVMGQTGEESFTGILRQLARDPDSLVRCGAIRALRRINLARAASPPATSIANEC